MPTNNVPLLTAADARAAMYAVQFRAASLDIVQDPNTLAGLRAIADGRALVVAKPPEPKPLAAQREASEVEERFFIDHGTIHDRVTGRHLRAVIDNVFPEGEVHETLATLNELWAEVLIARFVAGATAKLRPDPVVPEVTDEALERMWFAFRECKSNDARDCMRAALNACRAAGS